MNKGRGVHEIITYYGKGVTPKYVTKSSIIVLNQKCVRNNRIDYSFAQFIDDTKEYSQNKFLKKGDILINSTGQGTAGRVALIDNIPNGFKLIVDSHILVLRTDNFYESKCLNYSLFAIEKLLQTFMDGTTGQGELDKVRLFNIKLSYPSNHEVQKKIATILSTIDSKIELNQKINREFEAMAKALYDYWFVQFDFMDKKGRPYKSSGGRMVYNETLKREIPEGWDVDNILKFSELLGGGTPKTDKPDYWNGHIPFFTPTDADFNVFKLSTQEHITLNGLENSSTKLFPKGTIFITARGSVGNIMIAGTEMAMNQSCYAFKPREDIGYPFLYFNTQGIVGYLRAKSSGSVFKSIVGNDIKQTPVLIPCKEAIIKFNKFVAPLFEQILNNLKQNQEFTRLRDWLLPMLMSGQVSVADTYAQGGEELNVAVESEVEHRKTTRLNIASNKRAFAKRVLAGKIVSLFQQDPEFTHIKFQKLQYLAEHVIEEDLCWNYYFQVAGPYDNVFMHTIADKLKESKWFEEKDRRFIPLPKHSQIEDYYQNLFNPVAGCLDKLFTLLADANEATTEIIATLYAVWNNKIILEQTITKASLIEDFYQWSDRKHQYSVQQILEGIEWLTSNKMKPTGFGKVIKKAKSKK